jgi:hypothetical protein
VKGDPNVKNSQLVAHNHLVRMYAEQHEGVGVVESEVASLQPKDDREEGSALARIAIALGTAVLATALSELLVPAIIGGIAEAGEAAVDADEVAVNAEVPSAATKAAEGAEHAAAKASHVGAENAANEAAHSGADTAAKASRLEQAKKLAEHGLVDGVADGMKKSAELAMETPKKAVSGDPGIKFFTDQRTGIDDAADDNANRLLAITNALLEQHPDIAAGAIKGMGDAYLEASKTAVEIQASATSSQFVTYKARTTLGKESVKTATGEREVTQLDKPQKQTGKSKLDPLEPVDGLLQLQVAMGANDPGEAPSGVRVVSATLNGVAQLIADRLLDVNLRQSGLPILLVGDRLHATIDELGRVKNSEQTVVRANHFDTVPKEQTSADAQRIADVVFSRTLADWGIQKVQTNDTRGEKRG